MTKKTIAKILFVFCWLFIGIVSSIDAALTIKYRDFLINLEQNPVAVYILSMDDWEVSRFICLKMFCTILVLGICAVFLHRNLKWALTIIVSLAIFQGLLLSYLFLY